MDRLLLYYLKLLFLWDEFLILITTNLHQRICLAIINSFNILAMHKFLSKLDMYSIQFFYLYMLLINLIISTNEDKIYVTGIELAIIKSSI